MTVFQRRKLLNEFEKWRATLAGMGATLTSMGGWCASIATLPALAKQPYLRGERTSVVGMGGVLVWVAYQWCIVGEVGDMILWMACQRGSGNGVPTRMACYYYCYCCY